MILFLVLLFIHRNWAACPSGSVFDASFNRCYKYVKTPRSFPDSEQDCLSIGGHLVSIQNGFENGLVAGTASSYFGQSNYWIGGTYTSSWTWTDGLPFSYNNWAPNQPDNSKLCAYVDIMSYQWSSDICSTTWPYVCNVPQEMPTTLPPCPTTAAVYPGGYCEDGWTIFRLTNSCYKKYYAKDFSQAESTCKSQGGHLTSIHSEAENNFILGLSSTGMEKLSATEMTWIGLQKTKLHGWEWTDGSNTNYTNWEPGEPADIPLVTENCATLISDKEAFKPKAYMYWRNEHCNKEQRAFICKKKVLG